MTADEAITATANWLDSFVIRHRICPFASAARRATKIIYVDGGRQEVVEVLVAELHALRSVDKEEPATSLLLLPHLREFVDLMSFQEEVEAMANSDASAAPVQVLAFHPHAAYGDVEHDAADFATRSPVPMLHLLRDSDVVAAEELWAEQHAPTPAPGIQEQNAAFLRGLGYNSVAQAAATASGHDPGWELPGA